MSLGAGPVERRRARVRGLVQGVGFRPFVARVAEREGLAGSVLNDGHGVVVEVQGPSEALDRFGMALVADAPPLARLEGVDWEALEPAGDEGFRIAESAGGPGAALIGPDAATCEECLAELWDPGDRRHRYPFVSCTGCGPRFTVSLRPPFDRERTTMAAFEMCDACRAEYEDPADRRFHSELNACPECGPSLALGRERGDAALAAAVDLLGRGRIVAVKGLGGYHLACDAGDERAVARLRERKAREAKPLAVMSAEPLALARASAEELRLLESPRRPVVLLRRRPGAPLAGSVSPGSPWVGLLAPYTPLHHLLCSELARPLVLTSGNVTDEPIAVADDDAAERLGGIADAVLAHDRGIHRRCEDSVVRAAFPLRRSRGFAPEPLRLDRGGRRPAPIVAAGAELKSTFCVLRGDEAFLSGHLGDHASAAAHAAFRSDLALYLEMLDVRPEAVAHDLHPGYLSTRWASEQDAEAVGVQHHHAHAAACLAEHGLEGPALALVFDGTGMGPDGTLWGGELLRCDLAGYERLAHLEAVPLPGGEAAIREPWRMAAAYLELAGRPVPFERWGVVRQSLAVNAPLSSGMGRLFDAVSALLGVRERVSYEGQAAIELELLAADVPAEPYPCGIRDGVIAGRELVAAAHDDLRDGRPRDQIAAAFCEGVADAAARACAGRAGPDERLVALSGGSFQNLRLLGSVSRRLDSLGFTVLAHRNLPPNDGGVSFGQAAVASRTARACA